MKYASTCSELFHAGVLDWRLQGIVQGCAHNQLFSRGVSVGVGLDWCLEGCTHNLTIRVIVTPLSLVITFTLQMESSMSSYFHVSALLEC